MTYFGLVRAALARRTSQVLVTFACIAIAFCLLGMLLSAREAFVAGVTVASSHRLRTGGASSIAEALPVGYAQRIATVPGVRSVLYAAAEPAAWQDDPRHLLLQAVPAAHFFDTFPELRVAAGQRAAFAGDKQSLMAGRDAVARYGWKLGQQVTLQTNVADLHGSGSWTFHLDAIYDSDDPKIPRDLTFVRYDYFNDGRAEGRDKALGFVVAIDAPERASRIAGDIDRLFASSSPRTRTQPENLAAERQLAQFGDFNRIVLLVAGLVFASMLLLAHNVWHERARMRRGEFATMKALGFPRRAIALLVLSEALLLTAAGAACGLAAAWVASAALRPHVEGILAGFHFPVQGLLTGAMIAVAFGLLSAVLPARHAAATSLAAIHRD